MKNNKTILRFLSIVALLCTVMTFVCSCAKGNKFVSEGADFKDKKTNVSYAYALSCYEPIEKGEEIYGQTKTVTFYEIKGQDPLKLICEENGTIFYAEGNALPTLDKMDISYAEICTENSSVSVKKKIESKEDISSVINGYTLSESIYYGAVVPEKTYKIRFADTSLGIYYSVVFVRYSEDYTLKQSDGSVVNYGKDFLYNRFEGKFSVAPEILVNYIDELS